MRFTETYAHATTCAPSLNMDQLNFNKTAALNQSEVLHKYLTTLTTEVGVYITMKLCVGVG